MKTFLRIFAFVSALIWAGSVVSQEQLDPIPIGGSQTTTQQNGQILQMSANGILANVYLQEVSSARVRGFVVRTSGDTTSGTVTITWVNRGRTLILTLGPSNPDDPFGMEGGEGDKRSGSGTVTPP